MSKALDINTVFDTSFIEVLFPSLVSEYLFSGILEHSIVF